MKYIYLTLSLLLCFSTLPAQTTWQEYTKIADSLQVQFQFKNAIEPREKAIELAAVNQKDTIPFLNLLLAMSKNELNVDNPEINKPIYKELQSQILELEARNAKPERLYQAYRRMYIIAHNFIRNMEDTDVYVGKSIAYHYRCKTIDSLVLLKSLHGSGVVSREVGKLNKSVKVFKEAERFYGFMTIKDTNVMASVYKDLAMVYHHNFLNIPSERLKYIKKAEALFNSVERPNLDYLLGVYNDLSEYEKRQGNYKTAAGYLNKGLKIYQNNAEETQRYRMGKIGVKKELQFHSALMEIYRKTGEEALILYHFEEMKKINSLNDLDDIETDFYATAHIILSKFYYSIDNDKALLFLNEGLKIHKNLSFEKFEEEFTVAKINIYIDQQRFLKAQELLKKLETVKDVPQFIKKDMLILNVSLNFRNESKDVAYSYINKLIHDFSDANSALDIKTITYNEFTPSLDLTDTELILEIIDALNDSSVKDDTVKHHLFLLALKQFESNFNQEFLNDKLKKSYDQIGLYFYNKAAEGLISEEDKIRFLNFTEAIEAKFLLNTFLANRNISGKTEADVIVKKEQQIRSNITYLKRKNIGSKSDSLSQLIFEENEKLKTIKEQLQEGGFNVSKLINITNPLQNLETFKDRYIIKFKVIKNQLFRICYYDHKVAVTKLEDYKSLSTQVKDLVSELKDINIPVTTIKRHSKSLYNALLGGIDVLAIDNVHIIPDDILHYLPFELLVFNDTYVLNQTKVSYASALSFINSPIHNTKKNGKIALFAPSYSLFTPSNKQLAVRGEPYYLEGALKEVSSISKLFENSDVYTNDKASKASFKSLSPNYSILHLSMHSFLNDNDSELSSLVFSDDDEDHKLYISELYGLNLNADMAVLSACNTGVGELKTGKGIVSMNTAFTAAGVPSVLSSLWSAPDDATQEIMVSFYKHLKEGNDKSKALQLAKLDYLDATENELLKHPYYWAGFIISGDISPITTKDTYTIWYIIGGLILVLLIFVFIKRKQVI
ncbi:CHAT domain-containing protein [Psychroserpens damuponensis]|uniref:CHAT domain-containing protein n=1 Tax=Psychroserpens damuponensis TaxID=943936 RepID=UPI00058AD768|nr:CHAT domain-containing tetratricopeptide repeat protein [Psychroserpens damuponensis]